MNTMYFCWGRPLGNFSTTTDSPEHFLSQKFLHELPNITFTEEIAAVISIMVPRMFRDIALELI